jgi:hypothetical protein
MFMNGMRANTLDMFVKATNTHDKVVIIAGGVGITPYISLLHAIRQLSVATMSEMMKNKAMSLNTVLEDADSVDASSSCSTAKCIDVHWLSREEGLIRHVLTYLEPYRHVAKDGSNGVPPITLNFVVHHTSKTVPKMESCGTNSLGSAISDEPATTWQPNQVKTSACPFTTSAYECNQASPIRNVLATATYAFIVFGGMWIVHSCYENIQDKNVFQTRPIAVVSIIGFALIASLVSYGVVFFVTSKVRAGNGSKGEIELESVATDEDSDYEAFTNFVFDERRSELDSSKSCHVDEMSVMSISHLHGRPDLDEIVQVAVDNGGDVGIFMCGPTPMTKRIRGAIKREEDSNRRLCGTRGSSISVYQELFEF